MTIGQSEKNAKVISADQVIAREPTVCQSICLDVPETASSENKAGPLSLGTNDSWNGLDPPPLFEDITVDVPSKGSAKLLNVNGLDSPAYPLTASPFRAAVTKLASGGASDTTDHYSAVEFCSAYTVDVDTEYRIQNSLLIPHGEIKKMTGSVQKDKHHDLKKGKQVKNHCSIKIYMYS
ncbi:hypothetical protein ElyMa_003563400 [Elysia marginata]|uniref:Uncharacterized protein n=1 Tax=Elysia marginata TaxID=1093978 RepID=A0AAV4ELQ0_9GAST|nr:hypothetical protein ElyMa_003563400 [Elysia marginata]